ncbi:MAG TPA: hypothetical protein VM432_12410, partial [Bdellovibrionales bacterium]|nr:hypothetical protein [Bdellovibrionales bacterium]
MACFEIFQQPGQLMKDYGKILLTLFFFSLVFELPSANAFTGLGPVSGKVYRLDDNSPPLVFGAIIEIRAFAGDDQPNNFVRASVLPAYRVSENLIFNSSLTVRDTTDDDSIDIDYLYADLIKGDSETTLGFRLGHILVPFGVTNLQFEPTMYPGVNRPMFEETLFPKAWSENGAIGFILVGPIQGQVGTLYDDDFGFFARVDTAPAGNGTGFIKPGLGVSLYSGTVAEISEENVNLAELHGAIRFDRFQFAAILTGGLLTDEERIGGST